MSDFNRKLKQMAANEERAVPDCVHQRVEDVLSSLPEQREEKIPYGIPTWIRRAGALAAALLFVTLIVLPNVSEVCADTLGKVPVIGNLVRVLTVRSYFLDADGYELEAEIPAVDEPGFGAGQVNDDVSGLTARLVEEFCEEVKIHGTDGHGSLNITYDTVLNTERWFTLRLSVSETSGGSALTFYYYHIDRKTGKQVKLGDLFDKAGWETVLETALIEKMQAEEMADSSLVYWYASDDTGYEGLQLTGDHDYLVTDDGNLIISFDEYEIASGYMGTPYFTVETEVFEEYLADAYRDLFS
jgi:hypothetical protein